MLHAAYHVPLAHPLAGLSLMRRLQWLDRRHHDQTVMTKVNISYPLCDWIFGTLDRNSTARKETELLMTRFAPFCLLALLGLSGCKDLLMSAECKAVLQLPPPPLMSMETRTEVNSDGTLSWFVGKPNPGQLPLMFDVSRDTNGFATAPLLYIEPGGRELVFTWTSSADDNSFDLAIPRLAFTRTVPAVGKVRPPITLLFPVEPEIATISQSPQDGAGFLRARSHTAARGGTFEAVDINAPFGTPIVAPADGFVAHTHDDSPNVRCNHAAHSGYGNYVLLVNDDDVTIMLGHVAQGSIVVESGTHVRRGDLIAQVGHTGSSGVDHVHLVAMALGPSGIDSIPIRFAACGTAAEGWTPRNGTPCR